MKLVKSVVWPRKVWLWSLENGGGNMRDLSGYAKSGQT